jgi:hypothetical protein
MWTNGVADRFALAFDGQVAFSEVGQPVRSPTSRTPHPDRDLLGTCGL